MAHTDDPPFLTVGTEVSAKYRGAFCEATIKVAKKLVKCKVSYSKGQSALVSNELIKGELKVGAQVEVKQSDNHYQPATILKLTDQTTYTVVFDDGDERTLKRSSLCLKGGRHFDKSESLDHLPLTDPENFGTPVIQKSGRRKRHLSHSPSREEDSKRKCSYPAEFPVGKTVFLENDRRRCWLPAVIVPAHFVLREAEMQPDTIYLRSFKDGRYFEATPKELHEFSPDKEPLLSMLEGEVQGMYMCKPAIEQALAYLDTGELPWDMDLFDKSSEQPPPPHHPPPSRIPHHPLHHPHHPHTSTTTSTAATAARGGRGGGASTTSSERDSSPGSATRSGSSGAEDTSASEEDTSVFNKRLGKFLESKGTPLMRQPTLAQKDLNLCRLYQLVREKGGMERVTQEMKWRSIYMQLGMPSSSNASYSIKQAYKKYLYQFEVHERGKTKASSSGSSSGGMRELQVRHTRRRTLESSGDSKESLSGDSKRAKLVKQVSKETEVKECEAEEELRSSSSLVGGADLPDSSQSNDNKSEISDQDSTQADSGSCNGDEMVQLPEELVKRRTSGMERCSPGTYREKDRVYIYYGKLEDQLTYEAKIIGIEETAHRRDYLVHYNGWNHRYDEWIDESRIAGKITSPVKVNRPTYAKKKVVKKKPKVPPPASSPSHHPPTSTFPTSSPHQAPPPHSPAPTVALPQAPPAGAGLSGSKSTKRNKEEREKKTPSAIPTSLPTGEGNLSSSSAKTTPTGQPWPLTTGGGGGGRVKKRLSSSTTPSESSSSNLPFYSPSSCERSPETERKPLVTPLSPPSLDTATVSSPTSSSSTVLSRTNSITQNGEVDAVDEEIVVKREENTNWSSPPKEAARMSRTSPASRSSSSSSVGGDGIGSSREDSKASLICSESLPSYIPEVKATTSNHTGPAVAADNARQAAKTMASLSSSSSPSSSFPPVVSPPPLVAPFTTTTSSPYHKKQHPSLRKSSDSLSTSSSSGCSMTESLSSPPKFDSLTREKSPLCERTPVVKHENEEDLQDGDYDMEEEEEEEEDCTGGKLSSSSLAAMGVEREDSSPDDIAKSSGGSDKEQTPPVLQQRRKRPGGLKGSPDGKRKCRAAVETAEEYEMRRQERRADMNFVINFAEMPEMAAEERVTLIQERIRELQRRWTELKTEVAYHDRRRRRAKRKEREAARLLASSSQQTSSSPPNQSAPQDLPPLPTSNTPSSIPCH